MCLDNILKLLETVVWSLVALDVGDDLEEELCVLVVAVTGGIVGGGGRINREFDAPRLEVLCQVHKSESSVNGNASDAGHVAGSE